MGKTLEQLNLSSAFLFAAALSDPDTLNRWFTASVKAETQEEFIKNM